MTNKYIDNCTLYYRDASKIENMMPSHGKHQHVWTDRWIDPRKENLHF